MTQGSSFSFRAPDEELDGIPVTELGDPVEKTYVVAVSLHWFAQWCRACGVKPSSLQVAFLRRDDKTAQKLSPFDTSWKWVVFVGVTPPAENAYSNSDVGGVLHHLDGKRRAGQFDRAWYYPHLLIKPNVQPSPLLDGDGRDW